ncbi:MAG: zinc-binding dehydrogenase [Chloroflexota bacterium]|nr:zinc-binding dehydrogenase [Chloroflexota bacterium]
MLARGGTLVSYATVSTVYQAGNPLVPILKLIARLAAWNVLPNGRHASFFNVWAGHGRNPDRYRKQLRSDLSEVLARVAQKAITPRIDRTFDLADAALRYTETSSTAGKVVLIP